ncbi:N-methyl-L-tryptophan oxidase [Paenibacillus spongiae]|uniref:N-methyl-L-tryptophan oxidase n=1 Tax=Paenibacillus spongiae TaxID=2909671 RepID=A0ABY5S999_9BACL|nr:N-methyl-L-tryptophan oxidase [Paenibacillus spongiae]UVI30502.1 N-methyl-L-tryptophan oxidase [Paenibacillus spongiae]
MMDAEVAVIGIGTIGSMTMWQLARRGVKVIGFEQFGTGHDRSAAGGESRIFRTAYLEGSEYVPMLHEARKQWRELEKETGYSLLHLNGGLMIGPAEGDTIRSVMKSIETHGLEHEYLEYDEAQKRYPQHKLFPGEVMVLDKQAGFIRPEFAVVSAVQRSEALGAVIHRYTQVESIEPDGDGVRIVANGKTYKVGQVVITTGPYTKKLLPEQASPLVTRRLVMSFFATTKPEMYTPDKFPIFIRRSKHFDISGKPTLEGTMVKVMLNQGYDEVDDPHNLNRHIAIDDLNQINEAVRELLPDLIADPIRLNAYMDAYSPDEHAIIGRLPDMPRAIALYGFSGHGFKLAPAMGRIAADLVVDGGTPFSIEQFSPERIRSGR